MVTSGGSGSYSAPPLPLDLQVFDFWLVVESACGQPRCGAEDAAMGLKMAKDDKFICYST